MLKSTLRPGAESGRGGSTTLHTHASKTFIHSRLSASEPPRGEPSANPTINTRTTPIPILFRSTAGAATPPRDRSRRHPTANPALLVWLHSTTGPSRLTIAFMSRALAWPLASRLLLIGLRLPQSSRETP